MTETIQQLGLKLKQEQNQKKRILQFIQSKGFINRLLSYEMLGIFELSARICELEKDGYRFAKENKRGKSRLGYEFNYTEYRLIG